MFFFLSLFGQRADGVIQAVSLPALADISPLLKGCYFICVIGMVLWGILTLGLQICSHPLWAQCKRSVSLALGGLSALLFIISSQPYGAAFLFLFLAIKAIILIKKQ